MTRVISVPLGTALMAGPAVPAATENLDPITRSKIDSDLAKASAVGQLLNVSNRYAAAACTQQAKQVLDRAPRQARSGWSRRPSRPRTGGSAMRRTWR